MGLVTSKNFIKANALEVVAALPPSPPPVMRYVLKKDFGRVPAYLQQRKADMESHAHQQMIEQQDQV